MLKENLVLIGNGMAGVRTLEELLKLAPDQYNITVFGEEPYGNYNRIMLSPVLASEKTIEQIMLNDESWYTDNGITLHKGKKVEEINRARREVIATDGTVAHYDRLIIATGSVPFMLPIPGADKAGRDRFPRHQRRGYHAGSRPASTNTRWSSAAACSVWKRQTA